MTALYGFGMPAQLCWVVISEKRESEREDREREERERERERKKEREKEKELLCRG